MIGIGVLVTLDDPPLYQCHEIIIHKEKIIPGDFDILGDS